MTPTKTIDDIHRLGDALERATERDLGARPRRLMRKAALAVAAVLVIGSGTAIAAGLFSPAQVAAGMPAGAAIFGQTDPRCVADTDTVTFHCTLAVAPSEDIGDDGNKAGAAPSVMDYLGSKQILGIDDRIAGGCIGTDHQGLTWDCYIGMAAVEHEILVEDMLNQPMTEPSHG
jgi:hypothetical protein